MLPCDRAAKAFRPAGKAPGSAVETVAVQLSLSPEGQRAWRAPRAIGIHQLVEKSLSWPRDRFATSQPESLRHETSASNSHSRHEHGKE
jgi:hypothetical protein